MNETFYFKVIEVGKEFAVLRHVARPGQAAIAPDVIVRGKRELGIGETVTVRG